jgi:hypothetical protein
MSLKGFERKWSCPNQGTTLVFFVEGLRKTTRNLNQDSWCPGQGTKYDFKSVTFMLTVSVIKLFFWAKRWLLSLTNNCILTASSFTLLYTNWYWSSAHYLYIGTQILQCTDNLQARRLIRTTTSTQILWHTKTHMQWVTLFHSLKVGCPGHEADSPFSLVLRLTCSLPVLSLDWLKYASY